MMMVLIIIIDSSLLNSLLWLLGNTAVLWPTGKTAAPSDISWVMKTRNNINKKRKRKPQHNNFQSQQKCLWSVNTEWSHKPATRSIYSENSVAVCWDRSETVVIRRQYSPHPIKDSFHVTASSTCFSSNRCFSCLLRRGNCIGHLGAEFLSICS